MSNNSHLNNTFSNRVPRWLTALGLCALIALLMTPLVVDSYARDDSFFAPKWAWIAIWTAVALAAVLARALAGRAVIFPLSGVWISVVAWTIWQWVACLWAPSRSLAFERAREMTWLALAVWAGVQLFNRRRALLTIAWGWIGIGIVTALWVLYNDATRRWWPELVHIKPNLPDWRGFLVAGLGNTSHIGDLLALTLLPATALWGEVRGRRAWRAKIVLAIALIVIPAGLIVSYSVGSNFGLVGGALLMVGLVALRTRGRWFVRRWARWVLLLAVWGGVVAFFVMDQPLNPHRPSILKEGFDSQRWAEGWPTRLIIWAQGLEMIRTHPWRGVGTANFSYVFPTMDSALVTNSPALRAIQQQYIQWTNAAHNEFLQAWSELGIVGLFLFTMLLLAAFYSLLRDLRLADRPAFMIRITLAGMLAAWLLQAQMNFSLQHPAGALTFYGLLLAVLIEQRMRPRPGMAMPALLYDVGALRLRVEWHSMRRPTALGAALKLPAIVALIGGAAALCAIAAWVPRRLGPVRAQREYALGCNDELRRNSAGAEAHFKQALNFDPDCTNCRSHYTQWLLDQKRYQEALDQLKIVRLRLNSRELWQREAEALAHLGQRAAAARAEAIFEGWPASLDALNDGGK